MKLTTIKNGETISVDNTPQIVEDIIVVQSETDVGPQPQVKEPPFNV